MTRSGRLNWKTLDRANFDRIVEALLVRAHEGEEGSVAYALDGRGGDDGIDAAVERGGTVDHIYQLKFFPDGFSGGFTRTRRGQIRRSFDTAMTKHRPREWTLVVPCNGTKAERKFVAGLRGDRPVAIHFLGMAELDGLLAKFPEIAAWAERDQLVDTLRTIHQEQAALVNPSDLMDRVRALAAQADARSPYWGYAFSAGPSGLVQQLIAKRPDAPQKEPLSLELTARFSPRHEDLRLKFVSLLDWGAPEAVKLPREVATRIVQRGPEWFAQEHRDMILELYALPADTSHVVDIRILGPAGNALSSLRGTGTARGQGRLGGTFRTVFRKCLTLDWFVPKDGGLGKVDVNFLLAAAEAAGDAADALRLITSIRPGNQLELRIDEKRAFVSDLSEALEPDMQPVAREWIDDLAFLERDLGLAIGVPIEFSPKERVLVRIARMVREGRCALWPFTDSFTGELNGTVDDTVRMMLSEPFMSGMTTPNFAIQVGSETIDLGEVQLLHPRSEVIDAAEHLAALECGKGAGRVIVTKPADGTPFRIYSPSRWSERWQDPNRQLVPEP